MLFKTKTQKSCVFPEVLSLLTNDSEQSVTVWILNVLKPRVLKTQSPACGPSKRWWNLWGGEASGRKLDQWGCGLGGDILDAGPPVCFASQLPWGKQLCSITRSCRVLSYHSAYTVRLSDQWLKYGLKSFPNKFIISSIFVKATKS